MTSGDRNGRFGLPATAARKDRVHGPAEYCVAMDAPSGSANIVDAELARLLERVATGIATLDAVLMRTDDMLVRSEIALARLRMVEAGPADRGR